MKVFRHHIAFLLTAIFASFTTPSVPSTPTATRLYYWHEGIKIHFNDLGAGRPVLFLHGFGASLDTWRFIAEDLKKEHRLILVDLKGHGFSDRPRDSHYSLIDHAEIVTGLMEHLRLSDVILVGHSLGSVAAIVTALKAQESSNATVSGLVLITGSLDPGTLPLFLKLLRLPIIGWLTMKLTTASFRTRLALRKSVYEKDKITDSWVELYAKYQRIAGTDYALLKTAEQMIPPNSSQLKQDVQRLRIPVLNILGEHDEIIPRESGKEVCRLLPRCAQIIVQGVGHIPHEEKPEEIIHLLREFLRGP